MNIIIGQRSDTTQQKVRGVEVELLAFLFFQNLFETIESEPGVAAAVKLPPGTGPVPVQGTVPAGTKSQTTTSSSTAAVVRGLILHFTVSKFIFFVYEEVLEITINNMIQNLCFSLIQISSKHKIRFFRSFESLNELRPGSNVKCPIYDLQVFCSSRQTL